MNWWNDYLFFHVYFLRAPSWPHFLRSFRRISLVSKPAENIMVLLEFFHSIECKPNLIFSTIFSSTKLLNASDKPWRIAPDCAVVPNVLQPPLGPVFEPTGGASKLHSLVFSSCIVLHSISTLKRSPQNLSGDITCSLSRWFKTLVTNDGIEYLSWIKSKYRISCPLMSTFPVPSPRTVTSATQYLRKP